MTNLLREKYINGGINMIIDVIDLNVNELNFSKAYGHNYEKS